MLLISDSSSCVSAEHDCNEFRDALSMRPVNVLAIALFSSRSFSFLSASFFFSLYAHS